MRTVNEAVAQILAHAGPLGTEYVSLRECLFRVLATDLNTSDDSPRFDKAMMDGFVVCLDGPAGSVSNAPDASESAEGSQAFSVVETITAGAVSSLKLTTQNAARIMTGAPVPAGGNCVIPIECVQLDSAAPEKVVIPRKFLRPEANIIRQGAIAKAGHVLMRQGTRIQPQQIAALAEFGFGKLEVHRRPTVVVLATGDELVEVDEPLAPGKIRNSNEPMLGAQIKAAGADVVSPGIARDNAEELRNAIDRGLQHDILLLTGGVSAGILDLVPSQLAAAGVQQIFHGVQMKPGKPLWFGFRDAKASSGDSDQGDARARRTLVFGLPGNPVSSLVCFELFVRPMIQKLQGLKTDVPKTAELTEPLRVHGDRPVYQPVFVSMTGNRLVASPIRWSSSSDLKATVEANGMALFEPSCGEYLKGAAVTVWLWGDQRI